MNTTICIVQIHNMAPIDIKMGTVYTSLDKHSAVFLMNLYVRKKSFGMFHCMLYYRGICQLKLFF